MRAKLIMFSIMTACTLGSCESILEIDPISEITMANYWKSESDVKGYLNGLYSDYRGMTSTTLYGEDRGDAMVSGVIGGVSRSHQHELNEEYGLDWRTFYENIHHCNMLRELTLHWKMKRNVSWHRHILLGQKPILL